MNLIANNKFDIAGNFNHSYKVERVADKYAGLVTAAEYDSAQDDFIGAWAYVQHEMALRFSASTLTRILFSIVILAPNQMPAIVDDELNKLITEVNQLRINMYFVKFLVILRLIYPDKIEQLIPVNRKQEILDEIGREIHDDDVASEYMDLLEMAFYTKLAFPEEDIFSLVPKMCLDTAMRILSREGFLHLVPRILMYLKILSPQKFASLDLGKFNLENPVPFIIAGQSIDLDDYNSLSTATALCVLDPQFDLMKYVWGNDVQDLRQVTNNPDLPPLVSYA